MKTKSIFALILAIGMLSACNKDDVDGEGPGFSDDAVAYLSITIPTDGTRASDEDDGTESAIKSLYLFTFDSNGRIIAIPGTPVSYYVPIIGSDLKPEAQKIAAKATQLLVIANPSGDLLTSFSSINPSTTFALLNTAITDASRADITDVVSGTKGFTMINSGEEGSSPAAGQVISNPLMDITGKAITVNGTTIPDEATAKLEAEKDLNRVKVRIERLASKIQLMEKTSGATPPAGASFDLKSWVIDGLNTTFYPYAKKTLLDVGHNNTLGYYVKNFYTEDPNFTSGAGLDFATADRTGDYQPVFTQDMDWNTATTDPTNIMYCIENTMAAAEQKFGNATRLVIKATYYPVSTWTGDWFSFGGINYETFPILQNAYKVPENVNLRAACDRMYNDIKAYLSTTSTPLAPTKTGFEDLLQSDLDLVVNSNGDPIGGEVVKSQKDLITGVLLDCIRWYQGGLCYYFNEIRHDDETPQVMAFGKYGVVRNNWYELTLASVKGPGTPWYPDVENPGPGDPDPDEDLDDEVGYLGIEIRVAPWIIWKREIDI